MRIYELARELGITSAQLLKHCQAEGIPAKSNLSGLSQQQVEAIREAFKPQSEPAEEEKPETTPESEEPPATEELVEKTTLDLLKEDEGPKSEIEAQVEFEEERYRHLQLEEREQRRRIRRRERKARLQKQAGPTAEAVPKPAKVQLSLPISVREFSRLTGVRVQRIISDLMRNNIFVTVNHNIPDELVEPLAVEYGVEVEIKREADLEEEVLSILEAPDEEEKLQPRPPVVTLLGHVDHGKTTLLDRIRQTQVAKREAGGITQKIGAYAVDFQGKKIIFLDTPGHEAFTSMRARGANVTDIVVIVVAADDGVMPQTEEAISHARAAGVKIVVAVNKIDKPDANPSKVRQQLSSLNVVPEEWGGETVFVDVSALTGQGIEELLELLLLEGELLELKANPERPAIGTVLESHLSQGRGVVTTLLVQNGTLRRDDIVLAGSAYGRIRSMWDENGKLLRQATPSIPVEVSGLSEPPEAGERFVVLDDIAKARQIAEERRRARREKEIRQRSKITLEDLFQHISDSHVKQAHFIVKADTRGSLEVVEQTIRDFSSDEIRVEILHSGVGGVNESDILLAEASNAVVVGFNVVADDRARALANERGIQIRLYDVIYNLSDDIKKALEGMLEPEVRESVHGHASVKQVFRISRVGNVAGCVVTDGRVRNDSRVRVIRDNIIVYAGTIGSLKRFKEDAREVTAGQECGIKIDKFDDVKEGDRLEFYAVETIKRTL